MLLLSHTHTPGGIKLNKSSTCEELSVEHVDRLVVPGILTLQVNSVQKIFNKSCQYHGQQDGILGETQEGDTDILHKLSSG